MNDATASRLRASMIGGHAFATRAPDDPSIAHAIMERSLSMRSAIQELVA